VESGSDPDQPQADLDNAGELWTCGDKMEKKGKSLPQCAVNDFQYFSRMEMESWSWRYDYLERFEVHSMDKADDLRCMYGPCCF